MNTISCIGKRLNDEVIGKHLYDEVFRKRCSDAVKAPHASLLLCCPLPKAMAEETIAVLSVHIDDSVDHHDTTAGMQGSPCQTSRAASS
jgi:hypothetical protein